MEEFELTPGETHAQIKVIGVGGGGREHDLSELALGVRTASAEIVLDHHVVEVDGALGQRRDVDDPGRRALSQPR